MHKWVLLAYPRWHRDLHGADMLTTLSDAEADGRGGRLATLVLVADGVRTRFRVHGVPALLVACLCALAGAGLVAGLAGRVAWQAASPPWPTETQAAVTAAAVLPTGFPLGVTRFDDALGGSAVAADRVLIGLLGDPEWQPGGVTFHYVRSVGEAERIVAAAHAAGWRTSAAGGGRIRERDGFRVTMLAAGREPGTADVLVSVRPVPPRVAYAVAAAGIVAGALCGWLIAAAVIARQRRQPRARRLAVRHLGLGGVLAVLPAAAINLVATVQADAGASAAPPWLGFGFVLARPAVALGALLLICALLASRRDEPHPADAVPA